MEKVAGSDKFNERRKYLVKTPWGAVKVKSQFMELIPSLNCQPHNHPSIQTISQREREIRSSVCVEKK
jgi:hypothetical protein